MNRMMSGLIVSALLSVVMTIGQAAAASAPVTISELPKSEVKSRIERDGRILKVLVSGLEETMKTAAGDGSLFVRDRKADFDLAERRLLYQIWGNYLDHIIALESLSGRYWDFFLLHDRKESAGAFLLAYTAYLAKFSEGLRFINRTMDNDLYEKKLDEPNPEYGIPAGMYARLKWNTLHAADATTLFAGYSYFSFLKSYYRKHGYYDSKGTAWMFGYIERNYSYVSSTLNRKAAGLFFANGLDILKEKTFSAWFPLQMNVSEWMGDTKVLRKKSVLITPEQVREMNRHLEPGDIIVERRNWYLSNIGLPGFWPHAELYIGSPGEMKAFFSDPVVTAYYQKKGKYADFSDYLEKKYPAKMRAYLKKAHDGYHHRIIEAVSEGVKFSSLEEGTLADYIGVVRPGLSKLEKALAIEEAFNYVGRPYDFNFDFLTDSSLVCSELIYKIYRKGPESRGIDFSLREIAGRRAMPANDIVEKLDRESNPGGGELSFVYFLDGIEKEGRAAVKDGKEFRTSHRRMKWDIAQK